MKKNKKWILANTICFLVVQFCIVKQTFSSISIYANATDINYEKIFRTQDVIVFTSGPWIDSYRPEVVMKLVGYSLEIPKKFDLPTHRTLMLQIYKPKNAGAIKLPVILFSGGWGEDFRLYSTILRNISSRGYVIVNIDHYYYQNTHIHSSDFDYWVKEQRKNTELLNEVKKQEQFMKTKMSLLEIYKKDILFVIDRLPEILKTESIPNLSQLILMGHSIGGNADKAVIEQLFESEKTTNRVLAFVSLDSRLNQLGLKTSFEIPTLLLGASSWYARYSGKKDPLRELPKQTHLTLRLSEKSYVTLSECQICAT